MKKKIFLAFVFSTIVLVLKGQGLLFDDIEYDKMFRLSDIYTGSKSSYKLLEENKKINLKPFCPTPKYQGQMGSCSGWAIGYGAMSILHAVKKGWLGMQDSINYHSFSALYIYNHTKKGDCNQGVRMNEAASFVKNFGNIPFRDFDLPQTDCQKKANFEDTITASKFRVKDYMALFGTNDNSYKKIEKIKLSLIQRIPVVVAVNLRNNFTQVTRENPFWNPEIGDTSIYGAHAMVVIGYDDGLEAFEVLNSWGTHWGNNGFVWIKYEDFGKECRYGIQFIPSEETGKYEIFKPSFRFNLSSIDTYENQGFVDADFFLRDNKYMCLEKVNKGKTLFQMKMDYLNAGSYLYVLSLDVDKQLNIHWPRDSKLNSIFKETHESAYIPYPELDLIVPDEYSAFQFRKEGVEYLLILISRMPFENLDNIFSRLLLQYDVDIELALKFALGDSLISPETIDYYPDKIGFSKTIEKGKIAPIVIQFKVE